MAAPSASILCLLEAKCINSNILLVQYTSCMKVGTGGNLGLSREYQKKLFGLLFYPWWNCALKKIP